MTQVCSRCLVRFPASQGGRRFRWCSVDGFYVCERCWFKDCLAAHPGPKDTPGPVIRSIVAFLAISIIFGSTLPILASEYASTVYWGSAPLSPIDSLQSGEIAKVWGRIMSPDSVAYGGTVQTTCGQGCSSTWQWNWTSTFHLQDTPGTIPVRVQRPWTTFPGPHPAPWGASVRGTYYARNDTVYIVGTVSTLENGTKALQVDYISPSRSDPPPDAAALALMALFAACLVIGSVVWGTRLTLRRLRHGRAVAGKAAIVLLPERIEMDPSVNWLVNETPDFPRGHRPGNAQIAGTMVFGLIASFFFFAIATESGPLFYLMPLFVFNCCVVFPIQISLYYRLIRPPSPFAVGFTEAGTCLAYDSPYARKLYDPFLAWTDVALKEEPPRRRTGTSRWYLEHLKGRADDSLLLSQPNWNQFCEEWKRHTSR